MDPIPRSEPLARSIRLLRSERTSPDSTEVVAVGVTGVATEVVIAEAEEAISRIVLVDGAFSPNCSARFAGLIIYATGDAVGDSKLLPTKVLQRARRNASPLLALYICHTMYLPSHTAIHY